MDTVRESGSALDAAKSLLQIVQKRDHRSVKHYSADWRIVLQCCDYSDIGSPLLNEDLG